MNSCLLSFQKILEKESTDKIVCLGLSIDKPIKKCFLHGMSKCVDQLKFDFKVPNKRYDKTVPAPRHDPHSLLIVFFCPGFGP